LALRIQKNKERDTARFTTKIGHKFRSAGVVQFWVLAPFFVGSKGGEDKLLFQDWANFPVVQEGFHFSARGTPGRTEHEKDGLALPNCFGLGSSQPMIGAWLLLSRMRRDTEQE
jgi:hypothetical protein